MIALVVLIAALTLASARDVRCRSGVNGQACWALKYPPGQVPAGSYQELFAVASGKAGNFNYPFVATGYARRRNTTESDLTSVFNSGSDFLGQGRLFAAGSAWFWRGIGLVCDQDGKPGYQDKADNTLCANAAAGQDCVIGAYSATDATFNVEVSNTTAGDKYSTKVQESSNQLYTQYCSFKGATNTDQTVGAYTLGDGSLKCDITIDKLSQNGKWILATPNLNVWQVGALSTCPVANQKIALQVWTFSGAASTTPVDFSTAEQQIDLDGATKLRWTKSVTCTYADSSTVSSTVSADVRIVANPYSSWTDSNLVASIARINFQFECPRTNIGATNWLEKIFWDPQTETTPSLVTASAVSLSISSLVLAAVLILASLF